MAASKRAKRVRKADEFSLVRLAAEMRPVKYSTGIYSWTVEAIREARDQQMLGNFRLAGLLARAMRTDAGLFTAWLNRLAPLHGLPVRLDAASGSARAERIRDEGDALFGPRGVGISPQTIADVTSDLANHGNGFGYLTWLPRADGSRVDVELHTWPIHEVQWYPQDQTFKTRIDGSGELVPITHGDGRWVVFSKHEREPWTSEAAVLPGGLVWAARATCSRDWTKGSSSHGNAKVVGTMPEGMALQGDDGGLTPEAAAFLQLLQDVASQDTPVGIKPYGAALDYVTNSSQAWQIWRELALAKDREASKIYLGQDGTTSGSGGDYIKSQVLWGVRQDIVEGDVGAISRGLQTGVIEPWAAMNFGDSSLAPIRRYLMPDPDEAARKEAHATERKAYADRMALYLAALAAARDIGAAITKEFVEALAEDYGVRAPTLKVSSPIPTAGAGAPALPPRPLPQA